MKGRFATSRFRGSGLAWLLPILALFLTAGLVFSGMPDVLGKEQSHRPKRPAASTPVPADDTGAASKDDDANGEEAGGDPLDGDPLDGAPAKREKTSNQRELLEITRSGRPSDAPSSVVAYDDDEETVWRAGEAADGAWLWFDLERSQQVDRVRWLAQGAGTIQVSVSDDRKRWQPVETAVVRESWQEADVGQEARYVRLDLLISDDGEAPEIAEVEIYGDDEQGDASLAQKAKKNKKDKKGKGNKDRNKKKDRASDRNSDRNNSENRNRDAKSDGNADAGNQTETRDGISIRAGETNCEGDRERCRARAGKAQVTDECGEGSTCTIDVQVDGGSATCDATGGEEHRSGNGNGRRSGDGGRCEATANGGTVTMGDINP